MPTLYLIEQGAELHCDGERMDVRRDGVVLQSLPLIKIEQVVIFGNVQLSTPAIKRLLDREVDVVFLTQGGRFHGRLVGESPPHVALRRLQYRRADDSAWALAVARAMVGGKLRNQRALLQRFRRDRVDPPPELDEIITTLQETTHKAERTQGRSALMGAEGFATKRYFAGMRLLFRDAGWGFNARVRRPPTDPVNVLLSLGYTLLLNNVLGAVQTVGLDPYLGCLHVDEYNRPSLALDLMEEFRPLLVDSLVLRCCNAGTVSPAEFSPTDDRDRPILLSDAGKRSFVRAFEERLRLEVLHPEGAESGPGRVAYRRCIELQARRLARAIQRGGTYEPLVTR